VSRASYPWPCEIGQALRQLPSTTPQCIISTSGRNTRSTLQTTCFVHSAVQALTDGGHCRGRPRLLLYLSLVAVTPGRTEVDIDNPTGGQRAVEWVQFLLKAVLGTCFFGLILWCAQSSNPRAAGMMLTFPALNGLGLLTAESHDLHLMARAMLPMIALNGLLCAVYIIAQRQLRYRLPHLALPVHVWTVLGVCAVLWGGMALWVAPVVQAYLVSARQIMAFLCAYAVASVLLTVRLLWSPIHQHGRVRQGVWNVLRANAGRVGGMFILLLLVMLVARGGAEAWAGRLSALPLLPFYSLFILSSARLHTHHEVARLEHVGSTVLLGPVVAMTFVWVFVHYLSALSLLHSAASSMAAGVLGLLILWGLCGLTIWGILHGVRLLERRTWQGERNTACH
jgi:hypothetical protein